MNVYTFDALFKGICSIILCNKRIEYHRFQLNVLCHMVCLEYKQDIRYDAVR